MHAKNERKFNLHYMANDRISAAAFIPRYMSEEATEAVQKGGDVGVRGFNCDRYDLFNPFLNLSDITVGPPLLFPEHPHCGHEMFLYVLDGEFIHEDFMGWKATFGKEDVHWMTTGKGIIHAQLPAQQPKPSRHIQMWINLPKELKNCDPDNQILKREKIPIFSDKISGAQVKILVGDFMGHASSIKTAKPILIADVLIPANKIYSIPLNSDSMAGVYVLEGDGKVADMDVKTLFTGLSKANNNQVAKSELECHAGKNGLRFMLFAGRPLDDKVSVDGYFTCGNAEETKRAIDEFEKRDGRFAMGKSWNASIVNLKKRS